jgi:hypothetical protein
MRGLKTGPPRIAGRFEQLILQYYAPPLRSHVSLRPHSRGLTALVPRGPFSLPDRADPFAVTQRDLPPGLSERDADILYSVKRRATELDKRFSLCGARFGWAFIIGAQS